MRILLNFPLASCLLGLASLGVSGVPFLKEGKQEVCNTEACTDLADSLTSNMDATADPCDDFYQFACGGWIAKNEIPATSGGRFGTFDSLIKAVDKGIKDSINKPFQFDDPEAITKLKVLYHGCVDTESIEDIGYAPFLNEVLVDEYGTWPMIRANAPDLPNFSWEGVSALNMRYWFGPHLISGYVGQDVKQATRNILQLDQPLLSLPALDFYLEPDTFGEYIGAYKAYIVEVAKALAEADGEDVSDQRLEEDAEKIFEFEARLAEISISPEQRQGDPESTYNLMTFGELKKQWPGINWMVFIEKMLEGLDVPMEDSRELVVNVPTYFDNLTDIIDSTETNVIANYLYWRRIDSVVSDGPSALVEAKDKFQRFLYGQEEPTPREDVCIGKVSGNKGMPYAVGHVYVKDNFAESSKTEVEMLVSDLRTAFKTLIDGNTWMDDETKSVAKAKADAMVPLIGYPAEYQTPEGIDNLYEQVPNLSTDTHFENMKRMMDYAFRTMLSSVDEPVDRNQWITSPAVVNAFYAPPLNSISFPAAFLGPPFYRPDAPRYYNYGAIGIVIGHEITHGFDNSGRQYDALGNLNPWWPNHIVDAFVERAQCYIDQYDGYKMPELVPLLGEEDAHLNGVLTQGENIADNGGLHEAITAYRNSVVAQGPEKPLPGFEKFTPEQMFFISYGQVQCELTTPEYQANALLSDPHSPGRFRILGPLSNSVEFNDAFECPADSNMNREQKCDLW